MLNAVTDAHFDSSSSLTEGLWEVFKQKISKPLAHLLLMGDVWRLNNPDDISMWCAFVTENFPDRLMVMNSTTALLQVPVGLRSCKQPFGRLLALFDKSYSDSSESKLTGLLSWLLKYVAKADGSRTDKLRQVKINRHTYTWIRVSNSTVFIITLGLLLRLDIIASPRSPSSFSWPTSTL